MTVITIGAHGNRLADRALISYLRASVVSGEPNSADFARGACFGERIAAVINGCGLIAMSLVAEV